MTYYETPIDKKYLDDLSISEVPIDEKHDDPSISESEAPIDKKHLDSTTDDKKHLDSTTDKKVHRSSGEMIVHRWLLRHNIPFQPQKSFPDCTNPLTNYKLRFDIYIHSQNLLIEVDGLQHFPESIGVPMFGIPITQKMYESVKNKDDIKTQYAHSKGIYLLRIPIPKSATNKTIVPLLESTIVF